MRELDATGEPGNQLKISEDTYSLLLSKPIPSPEPQTAKTVDEVIVETENSPRRSKVNVKPQRERRSTEKHVTKKISLPSPPPKKTS